MTDPRSYLTDENLLTLLQQNRNPFLEPFATLLTNLPQNINDDSALIFFTGDPMRNLTNLFHHQRISTDLC